MRRWSPARLTTLVQRSGTEPRLINMYGITETSVHVTYRRSARRRSSRGGCNIMVVPIPAT